MKRFLSNLLPEGKWLEELSVDHQISKSNIFGLIALIGAETTGALTFQYDGADREPRPTEFREVGAEKLTERIAQRQRISIAKWDGKPRLSVIVVQDKLPIVIRSDGAMGFGEGDLASTHILKFGQRPDMHIWVASLLAMEMPTQWSNGEGRSSRAGKTEAVGEISRSRRGGMLRMIPSPVLEARRGEAGGASTAAYKGDRNRGRPHRESEGLRMRGLPWR